jgi:hypothetical protein
MKICSLCQQNYDDTENFCQTDGSTLVVISTEQTSYSSADTPTVVVTRYAAGQTNSAQIKQTSPVLYALIGGMAVLILGLVGFLLITRNSPETETAKKPEVNSTDKNDETAKSNPKTNSPQNFSANNSQIAEKPIVTPVPQPPKPYISPAGNWQGQWTNGKAVYGQQFTLKDDGNGRISGQIVHTLQSTMNSKKTEKIGLTAVEYVQGSYDSNTRIINLSGVRKDDPNGLIILDKYRLSLAGDNSTLAGATVGGKTRGQISLRR